jgi:uncharacterized cupredoxin-like copper-binding protein
MFFGLWMVLLLVAAAAAVGWASNRDAPTRRDAALELLDERLARGEVSPKEHAERRGVLAEARPAPRRTTRPWGWVAVGAIVLLLALPAAAATWGWGAGGWGWMDDHMGWGGTTEASASAFAEARRVDVEAGDLWFEPERIEVAAGEPVNLALANTGDVFHDLTVPAADFMLDAEAGDEVVGGLRLDEPGTYEFLCSVPGHAEAGMRGEIVVTA